MKTLARNRDRTEIVQRLRKLRGDSIGRWGFMSAHQMVCHLSDSFLMAFGEKAVRPTGGVFQRTIIKWIALYLPLPWPAGILTSPEIDQRLGGTRPAEFAADLARVVAFVERLSTEHGRVLCPMHPIFGQMSERAWLRWGYLHLDHHLRQFGI